jgi:hypothetical protein
MPSAEPTRRSPLPLLLPLLRLLLVMTLILDVACGTPPPPPSPPPLPPPPPPQGLGRTSRYPPTAIVRNGPRVTIDNVFTMEAPETAIVRRGYGDEGQPYGVLVDKTFQLYFSFDVPGPPRDRVDSRQALQIDGRDAVIVRYHTGRQRPWPGKFWLDADFADIYNEHLPEPDGNLRLHFFANGLDSAAQDLMERMVRSVRFLSQTRPEWKQ